MRLLVFAALATLFVLAWGQGPPGPQGPVGDPGVCIGCPDVVSYFINSLSSLAAGRLVHLRERFFLAPNFLTLFSCIEPRNSRSTSKLLCAFCMQ